MTMDNRLVLTDYSPVPQEEKAFCEELQQAIDNGSFEVIVPEFLKDDTDGDKPKVFGTYNNDYRVGKYAGILYYKGRTVVIHSRFDGTGGQNHFLNYSLAVAGKLPMKILRSSDETASQGVFDLLLVQLFLSQLQDAYNVGIYREYRNFDHNDPHPRGRLDISRHIRLNPLPNGKIAYSTREYSLDNPINHLILAAWGCLRSRPSTGRFAQQMLDADPSLSRPLDELKWSLGPEDLSRPALNRIAAKAVRPIAHPLHLRYETLRRTCLLILRETGLDLFQADGLQVGGLLISMDKTWELLLEHAVLSKVDKVKTQTVIPVLLNRPSQGMRTFKPDFLFGYEEKNGRITAQAALDAKYRRAWETACLTENGAWPDSVRADVFQVLSYMYVTAAPVGGIICPLAGSNRSKAVVRSYPVCAGMTDQFQVIPLIVPDEPGLSCEDFFRQMDQYSKNCADQVRTLLQISARTQTP